MWLVIALGVVGLVALLRHGAGTSTSGETGSSNGVDIDAQTPNSKKLTFVPSFGTYGNTRAPSPFTGLGSPSANQEYRVLLQMQNPPAGANSSNALMSQPHVKGTGLLDPLPAGEGTMSKQLVTADVALRRGSKV